MSVFLAPGVRIEKVQSGTPQIEGVSTSTGAFVGFTEWGPTDEAIFVSGFQDFLKKFGSWTKNSFTAQAVNGFFQNGGKKAYIVRVLPSDAVAADAKILSDHTLDVATTGDGTTSVAATDITTGLVVNDGDTPIQPDTVLMYWRSEGTPVAAEIAVDRALANLTTVAGVLNYEGRVKPASLVDQHEKLLRIVPDATLTINWATGGGTTLIAVPNPASGTSISTVTNAQGSTVVFDFLTGIFSLKIHFSETPDAGDVTVDYTPTAGDPGTTATTQIGAGDDGAVAIEYVTPGTAGNLIQVEVIDASTFVSPDNENVPLSSVFAVGVLTVTLGTDAGGNLDPTLNTSTLVTAAVDALPEFNATASGTGADPLTTSESIKELEGGRDSLSYWFIIDNGIGALTNSGSLPLASNGLISYTDGSFSFTTTAPATPYDGAPILSTYVIAAWDMDPVSKGIWAQDLRISISGNFDNFDASTASYSAFNVLVERYSAASLGYDTLETYEALVFDDPLSDAYAPDALNALSDYFSITIPGGDEAPGSLGGIYHERVLAGGDRSDAGRTLTDATSGILDPAVAKRSFVLTYEDSAGVVKTITDDGSGNLIGDVDVAGTNTITYSTGAYSVTLESTVKAGTLVNAVWYTDPIDSVTQETFGDTVKGYTEGTDGTFTSSTYSRLQFTDTALQADNQGLYALNLVRAILLVTIPDFVGDDVVTRELLDYVDSRANQASGADRFAILNIPKGMTPQEALDWVVYTLQRYTEYAAIYAPWVKVPDPLSAGRDLTVPGVGHIAGIYARTAATRNVSKAPAGQVDGQLRAISGLEAVYTPTEMELIHPGKIMPLISDPDVGTAVWGARTLSQESEWRYIQAVLLFMFVGRSIYNNTQWVVFENNGPELWTRVKAQLNGFLGELYNQGYFRGSTASEAFFVKCDAENNPPEVVEAGQLIVDVYMAPTKPAEFVRFRLAQKILD